MRLTLDPRQCGMGDVVTAAWLAEGANAAGHDVTFQAGGYDHLLGMLGQRLATVEGPVPIASTWDSLFGAELRVRGERQPRPTLWQRWLPFRAEPRRPVVRVPQAAQEWAVKQRATWLRAAKRPLVAVFPRANFVTRRWALHKFLRVSEELTRAGWSVVGLDLNPELLGRFPHWHAACSWDQMAAMMQVADCVLTNDSGPGHLAGTIGTKTFAVMGPTDPVTVFGHIPEVECLRTPRSRCVCVGCHFEPERGFGATCDVGCEALSALQPGEVAERIDEWHRLGRGA